MIIVDQGNLSHALPIVWQLEHDDVAYNSPQGDTLDLLSRQSH